MKDLRLDNDGDLLFDCGDVVITDSITQAITIRLKWFSKEWRINEDFGIPYFEDFFVKNPNVTLLEEVLREEILTVDEVNEVNSVNIKINQNTRSAAVDFTVTAKGETLSGEVVLNV